MPTLERIETFIFRAPLERPVRTSFGTMHNRPALLVRVEDREGAFGWGEVWCNFPAVGAEHRARLIETVIGPLLLKREFAHPSGPWESAAASSEVLAIQSGEPGPLAQAAAGIDIACWDLLARRAGRPLYRLLGAEGPDWVPAYASGIDPTVATAVVEKSRGEGFKAFKIKVGFHSEVDDEAIRAVSAMLEPGEQLMLDANQAWDLQSAKRFARSLEGIEVVWLEEPLRADRPEEEWSALRRYSPTPIAAGENLRGAEIFKRAIGLGALDVLQPDACKWGGISGVLPVAREAISAGLRYCPHYLGGGIGLMASAHLLAAAGGDGLLEVDVNPNPLRSGLAAPYPAVEDGRFPLPSAPGLGVVPDLQTTGEYLNRRAEVSEPS